MPAPSSASATIGMWPWEYIEFFDKDAGGWECRRSASGGWEGGAASTRSSDHAFWGNSRLAATKCRFRYSKHLRPVLPPSRPQSVVSGNTFPGPFGRGGCSSSALPYFQGTGSGTDRIMGSRCSRGRRWVATVSTISPCQSHFPAPSGCRTAGVTVIISFPKENGMFGYRASSGPP